MRSFSKFENIFQKSFDSDSKPLKMKFFVFLVYLTFVLAINANPVDKQAVQPSELSVSTDALNSTVNSGAEANPIPPVRNTVLRTPEDRKITASSKDEKGGLTSIVRGAFSYAGRGISSVFGGIRSGFRRVTSFFTPSSHSGQ